MNHDLFSHEEQALSSLSEKLAEFGVVKMWPHYEIEAIASADALSRLYRLFSPGTMFDLNWLFLSTSGVHGSYGTLDELYECWECEAPIDPWKDTICAGCKEEINEYQREITFVVVHPRLCVMRYGNVLLESKADEMFLRDTVAKTLEGVKKSQEGNLPK